MTGLERVTLFAAGSHIPIVDALRFADEIPGLLPIERAILRQFSEECDALRGVCPFAHAVDSKGAPIPAVIDIDVDPRDGKPWPKKKNRRLIGVVKRRRPGEA